MAKTATPSSIYKAVLEALQYGKPVTMDDYVIAQQYAKTAKRRAPKDPTFIEDVKDTKEIDTPKAPKDKTPKVCVEDDCDVAAYAKGRCSKHYTAHRREDADQRELANKASRDYRARLATAITPTV